MTGGDWMRTLARHVGLMRSAYPDDELALVFDIDGTIVDTRHVIVQVLLAYDGHHGTHHFHGISVDDVLEHESRVDLILEHFALPLDVRRDVRAWLTTHTRGSAATAPAHVPYPGVLSVIRWFSLQPHMHVAINTGRPESIREETLSALNSLGELHRITFPSELLFMNRSGDENDVARSKLEGLRSLRLAGYRIVAVVDNEVARLGHTRGA